jgi:hypothetical protein
MCAHEVHTYIRMEKYQKQCYLFNIHKAIITLTSEYRGTVTKLQAPFLSGTADWGLRMPSTSERLLELHYTFILLLSSTLLPTGVWGK